MKRVLSAIAIVAIAGLLTACGDGAMSATCDGYTETTVEASSFPNDAAATKAKEHLAKAKESLDKKDDEGCKTHVKAAKEALKL